MHHYPLWATPERRACLVELFLKSKGLCVYGHTLCPDLSHNYVVVSEGRIDNWKEDDRDTRAYLWKLEKRRLHAILRIKRRGPFDTIRRDQYLAERPVFKLVGIGVSAFTQHRVAKVLLPEFDKIVWIDLSGVHLSKNKFRKLARRGGKVPEEIHNIIKRGVRRYL